MDTRAWLVALALTVAGCAAMGGYQPTVDPFNDPYAGRIPDDEAECRGSSTRSRLACASAATMSWTDGRVGTPCHGAACRRARRTGSRVYHLRGVVREGTNRR